MRGVTHTNKDTPYSVALRCWRASQRQRAHHNLCTARCTSYKLLDRHTHECTAHANGMLVRFQSRTCISRNETAYLSAPLPCAPVLEKASFAPLAPKRESVMRGSRMQLFAPLEPSGTNNHPTKEDYIVFMEQNGLPCSERDPMALLRKRYSKTSLLSLDDAFILYMYLRVFVLRPHHKDIACLFLAPGKMRASRFPLNFLTNRLLMLPLGASHAALSMRTPFPPVSPISVRVRPFRLALPQGLMDHHCIFLSLRTRSSPHQLLARFFFLLLFPCLCGLRGANVVPAM